METCSACGITVLLRDSHKSYVQVDRCPYCARWDQEIWLTEFFIHYKNGHNMIPIMEWPNWIKDALNILMNITIAESEEK